MPANAGAGEGEFMKRTGKLLIGIAVILLLAAGTAAVVGQFASNREPLEPTEPRTESQTSPETTQAATAPAKPETATEAETEPETEPYVSPIDFEALWEKNPDVIGWITIEGTHIDYPILYSGDNDYYLHHDIDGNETAAGSIFLDLEDKTDMTSRHNVIYGHRMKDGSMFKDVIRFREEQFFKEHPYYTIYLPDREIRLKVISCYYAPNSYQLRRMYFPTQRAFDKFVERSLEKCPYAAEVEYPVKSLFTLITCSYEVDDARTMLLAVEVDGDGNQILAETAAGGQTETH